MESTAQSAPVSKAALWTGRVISGLVVLFMVFDGVTKVMKVPQVIDATIRIGFPVSSVVGIGVTLHFGTWRDPADRLLWRRDRRQRSRGKPGIQHDVCGLFRRAHLARAVSARTAPAGACPAAELSPNAPPLQTKDGAFGKRKAKAWKAVAAKLVPSSAGRS